MKCWINLPTRSEGEDIIGTLSADVGTFEDVAVLRFFLDLEEQTGIFHFCCFIVSLPDGLGGLVALSIGSGSSNLVFCACILAGGKRIGTEESKSLFSTVAEED